MAVVSTAVTDLSLPCGSAGENLPGDYLLQADFPYRDYLTQIRADAAKITPVGLYLHLPYCHSACYQLGCHRCSSKNPGDRRRYLDAILQEISLRGDLHQKQHPVSHMHWRGNALDLLDPAEITELVYTIASRFRLLNTAHRDYHLEANLSAITSERLALLKGLGFNRLTLGLQHFSLRPVNQGEIDRARDLLQQAADFGLTPVTVTLVYGLAQQTPEALTALLNLIDQLAPGRVQIHHARDLQGCFNGLESRWAQTQADREQSSRQFLQLFNGLKTLGYEVLGNHCFIQPADELISARQHRCLQHNPLGFCVGNSGDLIGLGRAASSCSRQFYVQNHRDLAGYYQALKEKRLPLERGMNVDNNRQIRRAVINQLLCYHQLDLKWLRDNFHIEFSEFFAQELPRFELFRGQSLIYYDNQTLKLAPEAVPFLKQVCDIVAGNFPPVPAANNHAL